LITGALLLLGVGRFSSSLGWWSMAIYAIINWHFLSLNIRSFSANSVDASIKGQSGLFYKKWNFILA
jgi:hypothetical protein